MIKINLLPKEKKKKKKTIAEKIIVIALVIIYTAIGINFLIIKKQEEKINKTLKKLREETKKLSYIEKEIKKLKEKEKQAKKRIIILSDLLKDNLTLIKEIDYITKTIPKERIFLDSINYKTNNIKIQGNSLDLKDIAFYIKRLKNYKKFEKITLGNIKSSKYKKRKIIKFEIIIEKKNEKENKL